METRTEEKRIYTAKRKKDTAVYKVLLNEGKIQLLITNELQCCRICKIQKAKNPGNFYIRYITYDGVYYKPIYPADCIECLRRISKEKGKWYKESIEIPNGYRKCKDCNIVKKLDNDNFYFVQCKYYRRMCIICCDKKEAEYNKHRRPPKTEEMKAKNRKQSRKRTKERLTKDISFKIRRDISTYIHYALKKNGGSKNGNSILRFLSYTIQELKSHLENLFEPWMNWNNWGKYDPKSWNDNDPSTWKWNIDHIIPNSRFSYTSMEDENFKKCWALENLRPYSAKQNIIDGNRRDISL